MAQFGTETTDESPPSSESLTIGKRLLKNIPRLFPLVTTFLMIRNGMKPSKVEPEFSLI